MAATKLLCRLFSPGLVRKDADTPSRTTLNRVATEPVPCTHTPKVSCFFGVLIGLHVTLPHPDHSCPVTSQCFWVTWLKTLNWTDQSLSSGM